MSENMLSVKELAEILKVHQNTIFKAIKQGKIRAIKIGAVYRISQEELTRIKESGI